METPFDIQAALQSMATGNAEAPGLISNAFESLIQQLNSANNVASQATAVPQ